MTESKALENLKYAHACDVALDLSSQDVHELWAEIEVMKKRVAELVEQLKEAVQYEVLAKVRAGEGSWTPLKKEREK